MTVAEYSLTCCSFSRKSTVPLAKLRNVGYILALKITAGRQKDLDDCAILLPKTKIRTRKKLNLWDEGLLIRRSST